MLAKSAADVVAGCILIRTDPIISTKSLFFCSMLTFLAFPSASFPSKQLASCIFKYLSIHFQAHRFKANLVPATSLSPSQTQESPLGGGLWARQQLYGGSIWRISSSVCQHCGLVLCNVAWIAKVRFFCWERGNLKCLMSVIPSKKRKNAPRPPTIPRHEITPPPVTKRDTPPSPNC